MKVPVIIYPPDPSGGRPVRSGTETLGLPHPRVDGVDKLDPSGLEGVDELELATTSLLEWHGGGPDVWPTPG
ncbi:hypothetical protein [Streptomyces sp. NPDC059398]|uniref:hypothetical protein n=1 Tax=Streptomyces sp. NPDC059398 TaxID=3346820 RepID=UPI0036ABA83C